MTAIVALLSHAGRQQTPRHFPSVAANQQSVLATHSQGPSLPSTIQIRNATDVGSSDLLLSNQSLGGGHRSKTIMAASTDADSINPHRGSSAPHPAESEYHPSPQHRAHQTQGSPPISRTSTSDSAS